MTHTPIDFQGNFVQIVNGKSAPTEKTRHGINPANKEPLPEVPVATEKNLDDAVAAAKVAFESWSKTPYEERQKAVLAFADAFEANIPAFAELLTREQGKPVSGDGEGKWAWFMLSTRIDGASDVRSRRCTNLLARFHPDTSAGRGCGRQRDSHGHYQIHPHWCCRSYCPLELPGAAGSW